MPMHPPFPLPVPQRRLLASPPGRTPATPSRHHLAPSAACCPRRASRVPGGNTAPAPAPWLLRRHRTRLRGRSSRRPVVDPASTGAPPPQRHRSQIRHARALSPLCSCFSYHRRKLAPVPPIFFLPPPIK
ncbi:hypothetical protein PVAP13_1KG068000 [Panicum virgatum]|uniref:Uncharacterized protein n=1 Tax=Panicum virgatum TaxID=38727 RepID=A0A8T0XE94_PANVG|nr:hypothetical protein PVAP13_1KG068000 [Panicum virgatum]